VRREYKDKKLLFDGKPLGGRNRLTVKKTNDVQKYYGKAIRNNLDSEVNMCRTMWVTWFHKLSTDSCLQRDLCRQRLSGASSTM